MEEQSTTIYDVARVAGVSMATVSRVVNGNANVKEKTRQKVLDAIEKLDYRPNAVARGLASKRSTTVGVIIPSIDNPYFSGLARGIDDIASMYKYNIILANSDDDDDKQISIIESFLSKQVDGIVFLGNELTDKVRHEFSRSRTPIVLVGAVDKDDSFATVNIDYRKAAYDSTLRVAKGTDKVAYILGGMDKVKNAERIAGYRAAVEEAGHKFDEKMVLEGYGFKDGKALAKQLLELGAKAAVSSYDEVAIGLMNALLAEGVKVPEQFEVVSGRATKITQYTHPQLTSIYQPLYDMGALAMRLLTKLMHKEEVEDKHLVLGHDLIERGSTKK